MLIWLCWIGCVGLDVLVKRVLVQLVFYTKKDAIKLVMNNIIKIIIIGVFQGMVYSGVRSEFCLEYQNMLIIRMASIPPAIAPESPNVSTNVVKLKHRIPSGIAHVNMMLAYVGRCKSFWYIFFNAKDNDKKEVDMARIASMLAIIE